MCQKLTCEYEGFTLGQSSVRRTSTEGQFNSFCVTLLQSKKGRPPNVQKFFTVIYKLKDELLNFSVLSNNEIFTNSLFMIKLLFCCVERY